MKVQLIKSNLVKYELRNIVGNIFTVIFGVIFPIFMSMFLGAIIGGQVPEETRTKVITNIFITNSILIPLATVFIGYSVTFSQELEKNIPTRFKLFGYKEESLVLSKISAYLIFMTIVLIIYTIISFIALDIQVPSLTSALVWIVSLYIITIIFFSLAHGIALIIKKFGPTYAITMILYFGIMVLSGMFGVQAKDFPKPLMNIAYLLPTTYIASDFVNFWEKGSYNFMPYIQSLVLLVAVSLIILIIGINKNSRYSNKDKVLLNKDNKVIG